MLPWQANIGRAHLISSLDLSPDSHVSKLPLWELCMEYDSCKRWTLSFAHSSTDCSQIWASTTCWICDWRKLCHNKGCTAHTKFGLHVFWTQTCKHWFIKELTKVWNHDLYGSKKSKSHRSFDTARDHDDLWCIAGNFCADLSATSAFRTIPHCIRKLSDEIASHSKQEEDRFKYIM